MSRVTIASPLVGSWIAESESPVEPQGSRSAGVRSILQEGVKRLHAAGMKHPRAEAEWLLGQVIGVKPLELYLEERSCPPQTLEQFFSHIDARASGVPLQYVLGEAEFFGERVAVRPGVFIPRPETEAIVEHALPALRARQAELGRPVRLVDAGTGSGCIALTLARALPSCVVVGVELSWVALRTAQENIQRHGLSSRVHLLQGSWLAPLRGTFDGVVSNPPYVPSAQVDHLPLEVRQEPRMSLDGGTRGLQGLLHLVTEVPRVLAPGGIVVLECGEEQVEELVRVARAASWVESATPLYDVAARPRGLLMRCQ